MGKRDKGIEKEPEEEVPDTLDGAIQSEAKRRKPSQSSAPTSAQSTTTGGGKASSSAVEADAVSMRSSKQAEPAKRRKRFSNCYLCGANPKGTKDSRKRLILDRTNVCKADRVAFLSLAFNPKSAVCIHFAATAQECEERVAKRTDHPTIKFGGGRGAVRSMQDCWQQWEQSDSLELPSTAEGFEEVLTVTSFQEAEHLLKCYGAEAPKVSPMGFFKFPTTPHILDLTNGKALTESDRLLSEKDRLWGEGPTLDDEITGAAELDILRFTSQLPVLSDSFSIMIHVFLLAMAAAQEGILQEVQDEGCLPGMQMLQRSLTPQSAQITQKVDFFNFQEMLSDQPPGSFLAAMEPLVFANTLVYNTTRPLYQMDVDLLDRFIAGDREWHRLRQFDRDPTPGGVFARVFLEPQSKTVLVAFKGVCMKSDLEQCTLDWCFLKRARAYGSVTDGLASGFGASDEVCDKYARANMLQFTQQADTFVRHVQKELPDHSMTLTGHSLGGLLSIVTAARQPDVLKAITFAPSPFHRILKEDLKFSDEQIDALKGKDLVATCDAFDCGINSVYVQQARLGAKTCLYLKQEEEPSPCNRLGSKPYESKHWRKALTADQSDPVASSQQTISNLMCKSDAHEWARYSKMVLQRSADGSPANLPVCSSDYSVLEGLQLG
ncbi:Uncharacterized protein SCF082_LOCUS648 [Durusdinium trenchii]|uniref:Serine aminopeptidase S33 domain-containing protein n=1 Tax=Durusdinium trenchii TaxID=1381693 RepID=A0ABP0HAY6_9DINO